MNLLGTLTVGHEPHVEVKAQPHGQHCVQAQHRQCKDLWMRGPCLWMSWRLVDSRKLAPDFRAHDCDESGDDGLARFGFKLMRHCVAQAIQFDESLPAPIIWFESTCEPLGQPQHLGEGKAGSLNCIGMTKLLLEEVAKEFLKEEVCLEYQQREITSLEFERLPEALESRCQFFIGGSEIGT